MRRRIEEEASLVGYSLGVLGGTIERPELWPKEIEALSFSRICLKMEELGVPNNHCKENHTVG